MPPADFLVSGPGHSGLLVDPPVVLNGGRTMASHHPSHDRPGALVITGIRGRQRRQDRGADVKLMLLHAGHRSGWRRALTSTTTGCRRPVPGGRYAEGARADLAVHSDQGMVQS